MSTRQNKKQTFRIESMVNTHRIQPISKLSATHRKWYLLPDQLTQPRLQQQGYLLYILSCSSIAMNTTQHNSTTQHNTTQHNTTQHNTQHNTTQHNTTQHNTTQHNTTHHNTTQHNTAQHKTAQHNTTPCAWVCMSLCWRSLTASTDNNKDIYYTYIVLSKHAISNCPC